MTDKIPIGDRRRTRRDMLRAGVSLAAATALSGTALANALDGGQSPLVDEGDRLVFGWEIPTDAVIERQGHPSWIVELSDDRFDELGEWAGREQDRNVIREASVDGWHAALIATPADAAQALLSNNWVESIDLDIEVDLVEPVLPPQESALGLTELNFAERFALGEFNPLANTLVNDLDDGLAYRDDMPAADIGDVHSITNATGDQGSSLTAVVLDTGVSAGAIFEDADEETRILDASADYTNADRPTVEAEGLEVVADGNGHGNWVASAMAASGDRPGYAPAADILAMKVLDDGGSGSAFDIAEAVRYAADTVGEDGVACLSLGSPIYSYSLDQAITYAAGAGMPCVVAAGNDRQGTRWTNSPADSPSAITVTATTAEDAEEARSAAFHNVDPDSGARNFSGGYTQGSHIDLGAPGCEILVATPTGDSRLTGTSMAAPCVAGGILQLIDADSSVRGEIDEIRERLTKHAQPVPMAGETEIGAGMLDVQAAVDEDEPEESQSAARDDRAQTRDLAHERLSDAEGGFLFQLL